jgi:hypothetical protein
VSLDVFETQVLDELGDMLRTHLMQLVGHVTTLRGATFVLNVESNMGYVADSLDTYMRNHAAHLPRLFVLRQDRRRKRQEGGAGGGATDVEVQYTAGTRTTQRNKKEMVDVFNSMLRGGLVHFGQPLLALGGADMAQRWRTELVSELRTFKREMRASPARGQTTAPVREIFSGKYGRNRDDWVMATLIASMTLDMIRRSQRLRGVLPGSGQ